MKKAVKVIFLIIPLIVAVILVYGIFSGRLDEYVNKAKEHKEDYMNSDVSYSEIPEGIIENYRQAFEWSYGAEPMVEVYDPDNKSLWYGAYGITKMQDEHYKQCYQKDEKYNKENPLNDEYIGDSKYNPDKIIGVGENFKREYMCMDGVVNSIEIMDDLGAIEDRFITTDMWHFGTVSLIDENHKLTGYSIIDTATKELCDNQNLKYIKVNITMKSCSEWVQEATIMPQLKYFDLHDDILEQTFEPGVSIESSEVRGGLSDMGIYLDLGYYDHSNPDCEDMDFTSYPMRKGEEISFNVIYVVPEAILDKAYLVYNDIGHSENYTYNFTDVTILKVKE